MKRILIALMLLAVSLSAAAQPLPPKLERMGSTILPIRGAEVSAVAWANDGTMLMFDSHGQRLFEFGQRKSRELAGGFGFGDGSLRGATDIAVTAFETWICDPQAGRIVRLNRRYAPQTPLTTLIDATGGDRITLERPGSAARGPMGDIVILELDKAEVLLLDSEGTFVRRVAGFGENRQPLLTPVRVEISDDGVIAIADPGSASAMLTDRFGTILGRRMWTLGGKGPTTLAFFGDQLLLGGEEGIILYDSEGEQLVSWPASTFGGEIKDIAVKVDVMAVAASGFVRTYQLLPSE